MAEEIAYTWQGTWDEGAGGPVEFFGGADGIPVRDLTAAEVANFTPEQKAKLQSETGKRLYAPVKHRANGKTNDGD